MVSPGPPNAGPGCTPNRSAAALIARVLVLTSRTLLAAILIASITISVLIEALALGRLAIAIAHVLRIAILIAARGPLIPLLIVVPFLIGHVILQSRPDWTIGSSRCGLRTQATCLGPTIAEAAAPPEERKVVVLQLDHRR
jgi:hypothetical protein